MDEDPSTKDARGISKICHEVLLILMKLLQTKPQIMYMNFNFYDLYYIVNKNRKKRYCRRVRYNYC